MSDQKRYEQKTVKAVRGTERIAVSKWEKRGWELVEQAPGTVRTDLTFRRRKPRVTQQSLAAIALVVALVVVITIGVLKERDGSSKDNSPTASTPDPNTSATKAAPLSPEVNAAYLSVADLMDAAIEAGYPCRSPKIEKPEGLASASERGSCSSNDLFSLATLTLESEDEVQEAADDLEKELSDEPVFHGSTHLVGRNWTIQCSATWAARLQKALGGAIATIP